MVEKKVRPGCCLTKVVGSHPAPAETDEPPFSPHLTYSTSGQISWWQWVIYVTLVAFGVLVTVVSTIENFRAIAKNMSTYGKPFSCHCTDIWNTCDCSESRMEFSGFNCTVS